MEKEVTILGRVGNIVDVAFTERKQYDLDQYEALVDAKARLIAEAQAKSNEIALYDEKISEYAIIIQLLKEHAQVQEQYTNEVPAQ